MLHMFLSSPIVQAAVYRKISCAAEIHHTRIIPFCADIKNMYTELPYEDILKAIQFILKDVNKKPEGAMLQLREENREIPILGKVLSQNQHVFASVSMKLKTYANLI